ncbi:Flp pilus assembly protein CpaB [Pandoraea terrae]|uniref:Flp pilus assembly protein CpaB n=1 Tax=Pandoraea terrae TaxID=1537710 RepID=A0A5E4Z896_9BURK|nr:Flp pilus assembly protein CpaB [Pandoraea terrae]VVE56530.1 Flp pilus assembly protein CpaB [Pandoraea terrae]
MNKATKILAAVLVVAGALLALFALRMGSTSPAVPAVTPQVAQTLTQRFPALVATHALDAGRPITAADIKLVTSDNPTANGFANPEDVVGRVPLVAVAAGAPITQNALARGIAMQLRSGERAVAIPVTEVVGAGNRIRPGDFVDVFFTMKTNATASVTTPADDQQARLLASRVRVLSYGPATLDDVTSPQANAPAPASGAPAQTNATPAANGVPPMPATAAVVAVPVADVNRLVLGTQQGKLTLALRSPGDETTPDVSLFPTTPPVLAARSNLSPEQKVALATPENQAYAGLATTALAGDPVRRPAARAPSGTRGEGGGHTVEVIRGAERGAAAF